MWTLLRCKILLTFSRSLIAIEFVSISRSLSLSVLFVSLEYRYVYWFASYHHHYCGTNPMRRTCDGALLWWLNAFAVVMQDNKLSLVIGIMCNLNGYPNIHGHKSNGNGNDNIKRSKSERDSVMGFYCGLDLLLSQTAFYSSLFAYFLILCIHLLLTHTLSLALSLSLSANQTCLDFEWITLILSLAFSLSNTNIAYFD